MRIITPTLADGEKLLVEALCYGHSVCSEFSPERLAKAYRTAEPNTGVAPLVHGGANPLAAQEAVAPVNNKQRRKGARDIWALSGIQCGFGLNPNPLASFSVDVASKLGVTFVPGRAVFRCARLHDGNRRTR